MNTVVLQITEEDIDRSSRLERSDLGRYYILVSGCIHFVENEASGLELVDYLNQP